MADEHSTAYEWAHALWHKAVADFAASKGLSSNDVLTDLGRNLTLRVKFAEAVEAHVRGVQDSREALREVLAFVDLALDSALQYPDFDCDNQDEPRPLCALLKRARGRIAAAGVQNTDGGQQ